MIETALTDLWYGFGVALQPHNLMWCFIGVLVGNMVGVLPGMGPSDGLMKSSLRKFPTFPGAT
jgi:TctA family transporter